MASDMKQMNTIEEAVQDLREGKIIICIDDPDRENEGDFICAAEFATTENINLMATHGKGLICMPMAKEFVKRLQIPQMVMDNTDNHETAFTVSIDYAGTTTGISAAERSVTAMKVVDDDTRPEDFRRPGHMFPLLAKPNGVLERDGHTEATVDLCKIAGLKACGLCCEIMRDDGTMMRTTELLQLVDLVRIVGEETHGLYAEFPEDLGADVVLALVALEAQGQVRLHGVHAPLLQCVGFQLVDEPDPAALLAHVEEDAAAFFFDLGHGGGELFPAVAAQ